MERQHAQGFSFAARLMESYGTGLRHPGQWRVHQWIRKAFGVHVDEDRVVFRAGLWWKLNPANYVEADLFWLGTKDKWEIFHILQRVRGGSVILDVGANFGYYSCCLAHALRRNSQVYAFEPFPQTHARLAENVRLNDMEDCVKIFRMGMSDKEGCVTMTARGDNSGAAHVMDGAGDILLSTIDRVCEREQIGKVDFIKIDVEGFEVFVLRGGERTILRDKPFMLVEMNPPTLRRAGVSCEELAWLLRQYGYDLFMARRKGLVPLGKLPDGEDYVDVFCLPHNRN